MRWTRAHPLQVVLIGNGMVGNRFAHDLLGRDLDARIRLTQLGDEPHRAYNRVLLSDVVAGRTAMGSLELPYRTDDRHRLHIGRAAVRIDRQARVVRDATGEMHPFDVLVMATGATARIPAVDGLRPLPPGAHTLRTLDDARRIIEAARVVGAAAVIGSGVLGVEVAAGLARRGLAVTLAGAGDAVMNRQFDGAAGAVAALRLEAAGVRVSSGVTVQRVLLTEGRVSGVGLRCAASTGPAPSTQDRSMKVAAGVLVLACGTEPEIRLAAAAGLPVDRGVLVDATLASPVDPGISAIGDCAQPPEGSSGLIAQGWEQSRRLAVRIVAGLDADAAGPARPVQARPSWPAAPTDVVTVKGDGLDMVAFGICGPVPDPGYRRVRLSDPDAARHLEVVVSGDRVVGGSCIGGGQVTADLVTAYTRRTPVPTDPAQLLVRSVVAAPEVVNPTRMPDHTTVCTCNAVSKGQIVDCWSRGGRTVADVAGTTHATTGCGSCTSVVCGLLDWLREADPDDSAAPAGQDAAPMGYLPETPSAPPRNPPLVASSAFHPATHGHPSHHLQGST